MSISTRQLSWWLLTLYGLLLSPALQANATSHQLLSPQWAAAKALSYAGKQRFKVQFEHDGQPWAWAIITSAQRCSSSQPLQLGKAQPLDQCHTQAEQKQTLAAGRYQLLLDLSDRQAPQVTVMAAPRPGQRPLPEVDCPVWDGQPLWVDVSGVFREGMVLREAYSGQRVTVRGGRVQLQPAADSEGLLLLEADGWQAPAFSWDNAIVYFVMTDRFKNGNPDNDHSYGRRREGLDPLGTFHGGDLRGVIDTLDYLHQLGINAIWLTPLFEQVHGFVGGESEGRYPFYAYHGYWPLDFTRLDANFGTEADLHELVAKAHAKGIRIIMDVVLNHVGYATLADLQDFAIPVVNDRQLPARWSDWTPAAGENWHSYRRFIDYQSPAWQQHWFSPDWVRGGLPGYPAGGGDDLNMTLAGLPDLRTEQPHAVGLPPLLAQKDNSGARHMAEARVVDYLIQWQSDWLRRFGIDGIRADTVKHVEKEAWLALRRAAEQARADWVRANPHAPTAATPLWMVGEVWANGTFADDYPEYGFDALINFDYQSDHALPLALCPARAEEVYQRYQTAVAEQPGFQPMSYISSHDTRLFFGSFGDERLQRRAANTLLLLPGAVQISYGDESGRSAGPYVEDFAISTRSPMNWGEAGSNKAGLVAHWAKLAQFRKRHPAIAAGTHRPLPSSGYAFVRQQGQDSVVVVMAGNPR